MSQKSQNLLINRKEKACLVARYATSEKSRFRIDFLTRATLLRHKSFFKDPMQYTASFIMFDFQIGFSP